MSNYLQIAILAPWHNQNAYGQGFGYQALQQVIVGGKTLSAITGQAIRSAIRRSLEANGCPVWRSTKHPKDVHFSGYTYRAPDGSYKDLMRDAIIPAAQRETLMSELVDLIFGWMIKSKGDEGGSEATEAAEGTAEAPAEDDTEKAAKKAADAAADKAEKARLTAAGLSAADIKTALAAFKKARKDAEKAASGVVDRKRDPTIQRSYIACSTGLSAEEFNPADTFGIGESAADGGLRPYTWEGHFSRYYFTLEIDLQGLRRRKLLHHVPAIIDTLAGLRIGGSHSRRLSDLNPEVIAWRFHDVPGQGYLGALNISAVEDEWKMAQRDQEVLLKPFRDLERQFGTTFQYAGVGGTTIRAGLDLLKAQIKADR